MSHSPPEESPGEADRPEAAMSGAGELDAEGGRPARPRRRRGRRGAGSERAEVHADDTTDETAAVAVSDEDNSVIDVEPDLAAAQPLANGAADVMAAADATTEAPAQPAEKDGGAPDEAALPPPTPAPTRAAEAPREHGRARGPQPVHQGRGQPPQFGGRNQGRQPGGRPQPLPPGVPSAAALDDIEPTRTHTSSVQRAEPQGDLALLLRGFEEIQQRNTDRMLSAMRQTGGTTDGAATRTSNVTERIGVFVDVPNLVYAARYLNRWIDFGRLLERLLGGRRLIRAHAYSPTDPDPSAEQQFLTPVKSQGFRLTTKNYRTFASGAKKADMDLDLCMDVVRLVVAKAVDGVVLCSGDGDFLPLLDFCSDNGVRVEVASFIEATSDELRQACDRFYNLSAMEGIRLSRPLGTAG